MTYIIADPDQKSGADLKRLLADNSELVFRGSFATLKAAESSIREEPPDIAFIRFGEAALNAVRLAGALQAQNPLSKVIFIGSQREAAVEAFDYGANGFLLVPFSKKEIGQLLQRYTGQERSTQIAAHVGKR